MNKPLQPLIRACITCILYLIYAPTMYNDIYLTISGFHYQIINNYSENNMTKKHVQYTQFKHCVLFQLLVITCLLDNCLSISVTYPPPNNYNYISTTTLNISNQHDQSNSVSPGFDIIFQG
jgi:hypothetical protein